MGEWIERWREWNERTHGAAFELRRHFFRRFFDSDLVTTPGQWRAVAAGVIGIIGSISLAVTQSYYSKYLALLELDSGEPYRLAMLADHLFFITLSMVLTGLFTALQWTSLFPGLRDYLALAGLPVRPRQIFLAKAAALLAFAGGFIVAVNLLPSFMLAAVSQGRYQRDGFLGAVSLLLAAILAGLFAFFVLVALQGLLLNLVPHRWFTAVSLAAQGVLLIVFLCGVPLSLSIPGFYWAMDHRPDFSAWLPPVWFLALDQSILGNREPFVEQLARRGLAAPAVAGLAAAAVYIWSYWHHRAGVLETPAEPPNQVVRFAELRARVADWLIPRPEEQAVFSFMLKTLARSGHHRLALTAYAGIAIAILITTFAWLALGPGFRGFRVRTFALQQAVATIPLALSQFLLTGLRYLFRLPVELRANWVFRAYEGGSRRYFLAAVERFLFWLGILPAAAIAIPAGAALLGWRDGLVAAALALMTALILAELMLYQFDRVPFTCSYLPGKRNLVETMLMFGAGTAIYIAILSSVIAACLPEPALALTFFGLLLAGWAYLRAARLDGAILRKIEYEEEMEPAVRTLDLFGT